MTDQYMTMSLALQWLVKNQASQPTLTELSEEIGLSEAHLQRTFQEYVGVSPKQFVSFLTRERALARLKQGETVLDAALNSGLSGPSRLHDLVIATDALTPGEARRQGSGVTMSYGEGQTPFGRALLAWTDRGITFLAFTNDNGLENSTDQLQAQWPDASLQRNDQQAGLKLQEVFNLRGQPLKIWLRGSPFQLKVWEALLSIPSGSHCTYGQLARHIGKPSASRATGTAIGRNPISWIIPCHRVITGTGTLGGYRWGTDTKQILIGVEAARQAS